MVTSMSLYFSCSHNHVRSGDEARTQIAWACAHIVVVGKGQEAVNRIVSRLGYSLHDARLRLVRLRSRIVTLVLLVAPIRLYVFFCKILRGRDRPRWERLNPTFLRRSIVH